MSALSLAVHDAANNCEVHGAKAIVVVKGGRQFEGRLDKPIGDLYTDGSTLHMKIQPGGWVTILFSEVAACGAVHH